MEKVSGNFTTARLTLLTNSFNTTMHGPWGMGEENFELWHNQKSTGICKIALLQDYNQKWQSDTRLVIECAGTIRYETRKKQSEAAVEKDSSKLNKPLAHSTHFMTQPFIYISISLFNLHLYFSFISLFMFYSPSYRPLQAHGRRRSSTTFEVYTSMSHHLMWRYTFLHPFTTNGEPQTQLFSRQSQFILLKCYALDKKLRCRASLQACSEGGKRGRYIVHILW